MSFLPFNAHRSTTRLGLPDHFRQKPAVVAPAPRQHEPPTPEAQTHVIKLLSALLNIEESAAFLENTPQFSSQLGDEVRAVRKKAKLVNERMMAEGHESLTTAIDTLNERANLFNQVCLMIANYPGPVVRQAVQAAADVVEAFRNPPQRPARRLKAAA